MQKWAADENFGIKIGDVKVLNVAAQDCREYVQEMMPALEEREKKDPETKQVMIHMGVDSGAEAIHLEVNGYNNADFGGPDNRNYQPEKEKIQKSFPLEHYFKTTLPVEEICQNLDKKHKVKLSDDPGRYICNYIYYSSLNDSYKKNIPTLFIHVPEFSCIDKTKQEAFMKDFLEETRTILLKEYNN